MSSDRRLQQAPTPAAIAFVAAMTPSEPVPTPQRQQPEASDTAGVVAPPPLVYLAGLAIGFGLEALLPGASLPAAVRCVGGGVLVLAGVALLASFTTAFTREGTAMEPWEPTTAIVTTGPYRLTRNPRNGAGVRRHRAAGRRALGAAAAAIRARRDRPRRDRA